MNDSWLCLFFFFPSSLKFIFYFLFKINFNNYIYIFLNFFLVINASL